MTRGYVIDTAAWILLLASIGWTVGTIATVAAQLRRNR